MVPPHIPNNVQRLLTRVRREARLWVWIESLTVAVIVASLAIATTLAIDWLIEPPAWARATLVATASAGLLWVMVARLVVRLWAPLPDRSLALAVERHHPDAGDALSTAVGLAAGEGEHVDPELARRTTETADDLAARIQVRRLFRRRRLGGLAMLGLAAIGVVAGGAMAWPDIANMWTRRMFLLDDTPWPRRVRFEAVGFHDGVMTVARGSDVEVLVHATTTSGTVPDLVELWTRGPDTMRPARMGTRGGVTADGQLFAHVIEGVGADLDLEVRGGDGRLRDLRVRVVEPPALAGVTVRYVLPAYLGGGERSPPFSRAVPVPRGSTVSVTFTTNKKMATARLTARFASEEASEAPETILVEVASSDHPTNTVTATIPSLDADGTLALSLTDTDGITPREPLALSLVATPDEPPTITLRLSDISGVVTPKARLPIIGTLVDDHGLTQAAIAIARGNDTRQHVIARVRGGEPLVEIDPESPEIVPLEPLGLRAGDRLILNAVATDNCRLTDTPNTTRGDTWSLEVVTPEILQAALEAREILLRRRFEAAIDDLLLARRGLDEPSASSPEPLRQAAGRLGEATARGIGEVGEIAAAFRSIRNEFDANGLLTAELESRLITQVAAPLAAVADRGLDGLATACRTAVAGQTDLLTLAATADASINTLKTILARLLELESFNEVVEKLRALIRTQEAIRADTLEQQRSRARQALEGS